MPVLDHRSIPDFPIGNRPLRDHHRAWGSRWSFHPHAWISPNDLAELKTSGAHSLMDASGTRLAWLETSSASDDSKLPAQESFLIVHSWDLLRAQELYVGAMEADLETMATLRSTGQIHPLAVIDGAVVIGPGTRILPGVVIEGNVVIGSDCKIGPNCYLRGSTSIGDRCHVGNAVEIKNSILLSGTNVGHLSYVGDSILGEKVNLGAGTVTSNLRHDGKNHRTLIDGSLVDTGRRKFGTIIGDGVHTGIHTSIYPGRKLGTGTSTLPGQIVKTDLPSSL
ncbi:bifunctional UDP-N-acetylglucosamine pyrophosphorylase/glucosamine-1-phosphate N-acetyltransferase [Haloferula luteola]|uniref:Bifunctional UDP-N-acetylglucosamine pyrophosphorylase/glucosamine-1-phosphate N-acetyltransferase n=1 Tax=Haloferula luteola TaxID=595692 RepID=A0A840VGT3_9BACT|nr:hypothetical protein [Haloferula luteola]MBB5351991.1 bifunctional UDP-N-acetylglucosamine pyrophosphorylase/glucosamine-1-phosphate N-acetyltransferase [Haloferula luteola]